MFVMCFGLIFKIKWIVLLFILSVCIMLDVIKFLLVVGLIMVFSVFRMVLCVRVMLVLFFDFVFDYMF